MTNLIFGLERLAGANMIYGWPLKQNWTSLWTLSKVGEGREGGYFRSIITFQVHYNFGVGLGFGVGFGLGSCVACTIDVQTLIWSAIKSTESSSLRDNDTKAEVGNCSWNCHHLFQFSHHPGRQPMGEVQMEGIWKYWQQANRKYPHCPDWKSPRIRGNHFGNGGKCDNEELFTKPPPLLYCHN